MRYMRNALAPAFVAFSLIASAAGASATPNTATAAATPPVQADMAQRDTALQNLVQRNNARQEQRMAQAAPAPAATPAVLPPAEVEPPAPRTRQAAPAKVKSVPEADLSGLPVRAEIRPPENAANHPGYIYNGDGVNCTLYPARCPR
ncbi:hypothetical protein EII20_05595 [Comamonadaceae bacterium OH2545_COT-014]|nr:hypothetical protein EII20_05595 [Comamonadaceae bacterium OH2545_COT-014]